MKITDKEILTLLEVSGSKTPNEIFYLLKKKYPHIEKKKINQKLIRLRNKRKIHLTKRGSFVSQMSVKDKEQEKDIPANDFIQVSNKFNYSIHFNKKQIDEAKFISENTEVNFLKRKDFKKDLIITIDGADAKDLDDAVSLIKNKKGYLLSVHIADVSYYVKEDSRLDREARKRGNSVYLVDKVIPMLPEALSNGVCSLNAHQDRLTLSAIIQFNKKGEIASYEFYEGIIHVKKRFSYDEVENVLRNKISNPDTYQNFIPMLKDMEELATILYKKRIKEGSLDFNFDEVKIICDETSQPIEIKKIKRLISHQIIEEFMLSANKVVAQFLSKKGNSIYRVHHTPEQEKLIEFNRFISKFGYSLKNINKPDPFQLQNILAKITNTKEERLINTILLRTMKQAIYSTDNAGHFALSFKDYTHFTSPIRRYSDLLIHRLLRNSMGMKPESKLIKSDQYLENVTAHISNTERTAMEAEREIIKKKSARFMKNKIGTVFDGIISGITGFGIFVELMPYGVEGLIRISDLKGFFIYDENEYKLYRKDHKVTYQLGLPVKVILEKVDVKRNFIDLIIVEE